MYIVLEGIDTTGKSTQIELLKQVYPQAIFTKEPYNDKIRDLALNGGFDSTTQAFLLVADRANHTKTILSPNSNKMVISDRSFISGVAYARELDSNLFLQINKSVAPLPNLVVVLMTNEAVLTQRLSKKDNDDIESNGVLYLLEVQDRISNLVSQLGVESITIDCSLDKDAISHVIIQKINLLLES